MLARLFEEALCNLGLPNVTGIPQPRETLSDHIFTKEDYTTGSIRLAKGFDKIHTSEDLKHMNAEYGKLALLELGNELFLERSTK